VSSGVEIKTAGGIRQESRRLHFRIHRLGKDIAEGQPENIRTQIIQVGDSANVVREGAFRVKVDLSSALVNSIEAAIKDSERG
jgi:hypothetical protein